MDVVEGLPVAEVFRHVGLSVNDRARGLELLHDVGAFGRPMIGVGQVTPSGWGSGYVDRVLDGHRKAMQRAERLPRCVRIVGGSSHSTRLVDLGEHHGVQLPIVSLVLSKTRIEKLDRRYLTTSQKPVLLDHREQSDVGRGSHSPMLS